jgi:hypothetical protein
MAIDLEHDIEALDRGVEKILNLLDSIQTDRERLVELVKLWRRPGWTTPAEFLFTRNSVDGLADQAATFQRGLRSLSEGVRLVGR